ncbi:MAG: T9SS type A sorting domain-containing protein [Candidatus Atribacteria bacterium]|nr:T9SS type A sorting domain-containing protein [Candidatus Atribacteria bacterium]
MKKAIAIFIYILLTRLAHNQTIDRWVISPFGNSYNNNFQVVQATLGEPLIRAVTDSVSFILTQGFHQPIPSKKPEEEFKREIILYPNPVLGMCTIQFYVFEVNDFNIEVWDMVGNFMFKKRINDVFSGQTEILDFTGFIQGIYFVRIYSDNDEMKMIEKIVKL